MPHSSGHMQLSEIMKHHKMVVRDENLRNYQITIEIPYCTRLRHQEAIQGNGGA